ncbi:hypothetical protein FA15DRAFT_590993 [Coprinopsis marcescibilis]|uniref:Proteasome assembly chaperone 3 n=1 Tax=Coprinopsis marcescibilis TaxID=230819 RepID=A0A5C3KXG1_COPMA|nr:hypothetical protein FA15DRAFT_590993 [Coprinopsis marcescibilis]
MESVQQDITVSTIFLPSKKSSLPPLALQVTSLKDSYMLWIGVCDGEAESKDQAVRQGNLCKDWAVAMPPKDSGMVANATSLFRTATSDNAFSMAQRLAKRFKKQIFLSVDLPAAVVGFGQGQQLFLEAERGIVETLKELEKS